VLKNRERLLKLKVKDKQKNSVFSWRHFFWRVTAVMLFFYLCANVSVLEYFCGNPSLGIASYRQAVEINPQLAKNVETTVARNTTDATQLPDRDQEPSFPLDGDDCFCCSSHALIGGANLTVSLIPVVPQNHDPVFLNQQTHSDWHLLPFYRPPRTA